MDGHRQWPGGTSVVLLSGGASRRLGQDKASAHVGGARLLDRVVRQIPDGVPVVLVGPALPDLAERVVVVREDPPGSGPVAAISAGLAQVRGPVTGVLAADMPFAVPALRRSAVLLGEAGPAVEAAVPVDGQRVPQPLCAAYSTPALRRALADLAPLPGRSVRAVVERLRVMEWAAPADQLADVDTPDELQSARLRAAEEGSMMQEWVAAVREALGVEVAVDVDVILDVAREAAHGVARPAAPLTTYLLGAAVAAGADPRAAAEAIASLARGWADRPQ